MDAIQLILSLTFLLFAIIVFVLSVRSISRRGISCYNAFTLVWLLAYALPVLVLLISPATINSEVSVALMSEDDWALSYLGAAIGYILFATGYGFKYQKPVSVKAVGAGAPRRPVLIVSQINRPAVVKWLVLCLMLQLYAIYLVVSRSVQIEFTHRSNLWNELGFSVYLFFLCLPSVVIAVLLFMNKRTWRRAGLLLISFVISIVSSILVGQRLYMTAIPVVAYFTVTALARKKPRHVRTLVLVSLLALFAMFIGQFFLRETRRGDFGASLNAVIAGDMTRNQTLAYVLSRSDWISSDLLSVPILPSYLYWAILPIPRAIWKEKPFTAVIQFNYDYAYQVSRLQRPITDITSGYQFGFIEEALMNLGLAGFGILWIWGYLAALADRYSKQTLLTKVSLPLVFGLGTVTAIHSTLMATSSLIVIAFILGRLTTYKGKVPAYRASVAGNLMLD